MSAPRPPRRFSWGSNARAAYPRWKSVALIELTLVVVIIGVGAASMLGASELLLAKVRMVLVLEHMQVGKVASAEHFAVTGRALDTDMFGAEGAGNKNDSTTPEYEKHLTASAAFSVVASAAGQAPAGFSEAQRDNSSFYSRTGVIDGSVVALGRVRGGKHPYRMSFSPVVLDGGGPVLLWTCGSAPLPQGYSVIGRRAADDIIPDLVFAPCRSRQPW